MPEQDLEDAMQDVFVRALRAFGKGTARIPADLREMKAFCAHIAKKHAMATLRKNAPRERLGMLPNAQPLEVIVSTPAAIEALRVAA